jgi:agmatinase
MPGQDRFGVRDLSAPWYSGRPGFMRAPWIEPGDTPEGSIAVVGFPFDEFNIGRAGSRWGPRRIREASLYLAGYFGIQTDRGFIDIASRSVIAWPKVFKVVDTGDVPIFPADVLAQTQAGQKHVYECSRTSDITVSLGGDHYAAYPAFLGVAQAWRERIENPRIGYLHIDSHSDFFDELTFLGGCNHGTCARRIHEVPEVTRMAWFGLNGANILEPDQLEVMHEHGYQVYPTNYAKRVGVEKAIAEALDYVTTDVDIVYVSIDIDVVNGSVAPATGSPVFEGLSGHEFLQVMRALSKVENLVGLDLCEVAPPIETSEQTERLAALAIITVVGPRIFESIDTIDQEKWDSVVRS